MLRQSINSKKEEKKNISDYITNKLSMSLAHSLTLPLGCESFPLFFVLFGCVAAASNQKKEKKGPMKKNENTFSMLAKRQKKLKMKE